MKIEDGKGTGYSVKIDKFNRLNTYSVNIPEDKQNNRDGKAWSLYGSTTPVGANDYFFYIKNTGSLDLAISDIRIKSTVATDIMVEHVTGNPSYTASADITPSNRNLGSSAIPIATIKKDTDITGLTTKSTLFFIRLAANTFFKFTTTSNIIIPQGSSLALKRVESTGLIDFVVSLAEIGE